MLRRPYGASGVELSIIGLGGIVVAQMPQTEADRIVRGAFDRGVNYYDVAPTYADAEDRLGPALDGIRDQVFLACKTEKRTKAEARSALETSLRKLRTDRFDLYQMHGIQNLEEARVCFGVGGAMETLLEARSQGLVRYLGFSAHSVAAALFCLEQFAFDSILFPLSYPTFYGSGFGPQVIEAATARGAAVLALKAMARRPWPEGAERNHPKCWYEPHSDPEEAELALRWTLSLPVTAAVPPGDPDVFAMALDIAERYRPLTDDEVAELKRRAADLPPLFHID